MTISDYFLSFRGRISRKEYWIGMLALIAMSMGVSVVVDPGAFVAEKGAVRAPSFAGTVWNLALVWPSTAMAVKRFNDRNWPWWTGMALGAAMAMLVIANYFGLLLDPERMGAGERAILLGLLVAFFWSIVENGFQKGTEGDNDFGPDPLA
jgi:uncharacterized membrane protein YhaH (DUF805 family)